MKSANEELDTAYRKFRRKEVFRIVLPVLLTVMAIVAVTYLSLYEGTSEYEYAVFDAHATSRGNGRRLSNF